MLKWAIACLALVMTVPPPVPAATAVTHVAVLPMDADRVLTDQTVIVRGDSIASIGPASDALIPAGTRVIDGRGKYLMPGLTDMHMHVRVPEEFLSDLVWGVTTVALYSGSAETLRWRAAVKAGRLLGPTIYTTAPIVDGMPPINSTHIEVATADEARRIADWEQQSGYDFIKVYNEIGWDPYHALLAEAKTRHIAVVGHIPRAIGAEEALRAGQIGIAHAEEYYFTYFGTRPDTGKIPAIVAQTKAANAWVVAMLSSTPDILGTVANIDSEMSFPEARYLPPAVFEDYRPPNNGYVNRPQLPAFVARNQVMNAFLPRFVKALSDADVHLLVGTDATSLNFPGWAAHVEIEDLVAAGLTPYQALRVATRNAGEFVTDLITPADRFGTVAPGMRADLVLLTANPLTRISNIDSIAGVMARGRWWPVDTLRAIRARATTQYPEVKRLVARFDSLIAANHLAAAQSAADSAIALNRGEPPFNEHVIYGYGLDYLRRDPRTALALMRLGVRLYPDAFDVHNGLARALLATGDTTAARAELATSSRLVPGNDAAVRLIDSLKSGR
jgi:imidazolonepropionase-like amidohydrolase